MAVIMPSASSTEADSEVIVSLQNGQYIPERILTVNARHALLWGGQRGMNRHLAIERIADITPAEIELANSRKHALLSVQHENIARCIDLFDEHSALYIVMVTGEGKPLAQREVPVSPHEALDIGIQICNALNYLSIHTEFTNHGAIEPSTVFITDGNRVKLTNLASLLGVAQVLEEADLARSDVFAVGATMHHALTGWNGDYTTEIPPVESLCEAIPSELCSVIKRALAPNPADRWANSAEMRYALLRI
ncbi:MAG TPA: hypothetical protein VKB76_07435 [Ktedonobacterales bacterium]|nr:hypothetical protein [Ktedonobacterales bacterium]